MESIVKYDYKPVLKDPILCPGSATSEKWPETIWHSY